MKNIKIAVMADIHSNVEAFKTCLAEAKNQGVTEYIFLGDYLGDLVNPQETIILMDEIKKNKEEMLAQPVKVLPLEAYGDADIIEL